MRDRSLLSRPKQSGTSVAPRHAPRARRKSYLGPKYSQFVEGRDSGGGSVGLGLTWASYSRGSDCIDDEGEAKGLVYREPYLSVDCKRTCMCDGGVFGQRALDRVGHRVTGEEAQEKKQVATGGDIAKRSVWRSGVERPLFSVPTVRDHAPTPPLKHRHNLIPLDVHVRMQLAGLPAPVRLSPSYSVRPFT